MKGRTLIKQAFDADGVYVRKVLTSGKKFARAFFPAEMTDRFMPPGLVPKASHKVYAEERRQFVLKMLQQVRCCLF